jgi:transaldolase
MNNNIPESFLERLIKAHPDVEIWWDSSPLVYDVWMQEMIEAAPPHRKEILAVQLKRLYNTEDPANSLLHGCTTNPPLSLTAVKSDPDFWNEWLDDTIASNPDLDYRELAWLLYKEVVIRGADMMRPIWDASNGRLGWISGQLDPRLFSEIDIMVAAGEELSQLRPNIMVKVPASTQGIDVLRILASKGISTNTTTCFTLPQILASARATFEGLHLVQKDSIYTSETVDLSKWRAVITMMVGRLTENPVLMEQARRRGIELTWADRHWFGIATFQRAYQIIKESAYPSKMLVCSMRQGPLVAGKQRYWDLEKLAGDVVFTCPPYVLGPAFDLDDNLNFVGDGLETVQVPQQVLDKLMQIPYAIQSYDPNGMCLEQFNDHPATVATVQKFTQAMTGLEDFVQKRLDSIRHNRG